MRLALLPALVLAAATSRGGCEGPSTPFDPCAGKACGETCRACPPADPTCVETAVVKACDPSGQCTAAGTFTCALSGACTGKACGDECTYDPPCRMASPPCMLPSYVGHCDRFGACIAGDTPPPGTCAPVGDCAGVLCGVPCQAPCPSGAPCPAPGVCDGNGACVGPLTLVCPPPTSYDPCAGKACHEACSPCAPGAGVCPMYAVASWCDGAGACVPYGSGAACP